MNFKLWLEAQQQQQKIAYFREILDLPRGFLVDEDAYEELEEAYRASGHPQAEQAYRLLHQELDRTRAGRHFDEFFTQVSKGAEQYKTEVPFVPEYDMKQHQPWVDVREKYHGYFDRHIKTSIPTFGGMQDKKGHAIVRAFGGDKLNLLDIGGSEGSWARSITDMSRGNIETDILDPNEQMRTFFESKGKTPGSNYIEAAFIRGWMENDGSQVPSFNHKTTQKRYDIIHEAMVFQFMGPQRAAHIAEVKRLLKPGGLFLTEEKLKSDSATWKRNEDFKNVEHKSKYYTAEDLAKKEKVVGFEKEKKQAESPWPQEDDEAEAVGMANNMVKADAFEEILKRNFRSVWQYWDSGNFKGYAASDSPATVQKFLSALGNTESRFSNVKLPREVGQQLGEGCMSQKFTDWLQDQANHKGIKRVIIAILPNDHDRLTDKQIKADWGDAIIQACCDAGHDAGPDNLEELLDLIDADWVKPFNPEKEWDHFC
jgi:ubiquinone/menaquinone biosynthesis C-methylase UbiE